MSGLRQHWDEWLLDKLSGAFAGFRVLVFLLLCDLYQGSSLLSAWLGLPQAVQTCSAWNSRTGMLVETSWQQRDASSR